MLFQFFAGGLSKFLANVRAICFAAWTFTLAIPLFIIMVVQAPIVMLTDKYRCTAALPDLMVSTSVSDKHQATGHWLIWHPIQMHVAST